MAEEDFLMPVRKSDIEIGKPLPFAVYDSSRNLLLNRGIVVTSEHQLEVLMEKGLYRKHRPTRSHSHPAPGGGTTTTDAEGASFARPSSAQPREESVSLDAIRLMPGDTLQLQPLLEGQTDRYTVRVIGILKPKSVLVTAPMVDGKLIFIRDGQGFLVRAFPGLDVVAFKAKVLKSQLVPYPYLHLSYPDTVQALRIRKNMRASTNIIVAVYESEQGRQIGAAKMVDISFGGAKLLSSAALGSKDQSVWLAFKAKVADDIEEYVKAPAIIRSISDETDEQGNTVQSYGVQFGELDSNLRLVIMNLVYQSLLKEDGV